MAKKTKKTLNVKMKCTKCGAESYHTFVKDNLYRCTICSTINEKKK